MSTLPAGSSKTTAQAAAKSASEGRPETLQYEVAKREADELAARAAADVDKWGTSTLVGQQAPVTAASSVAGQPSGRAEARASAEATGKTTPTPRGPDVTETLQRGATQLAGAFGSGFRAASRSLAESSPGALESLLPGTSSAELVGADPTVALSERLAAESDFWCRLGLRSLARVVIADRVGYFVVALSVLSGLGLAVVAGLGGLFAGEHAAGKSVLVLVGALALLCGGGIAFAFTHAIRRAQRDNASSAFARADHAELRLHRLAIAMALRDSDPDASRDALGRITDDASIIR